jgi:TRAP-type mannitol/chloroaromatic compound transport system substrate-binding protein
MDRREFLLTTCAAAAAPTTVAALTSDVVQAKPTARPNRIAAPTLSSNVKHLRLAVDAVAGPSDQARRLAQRITMMSGGRLRFTVLPSFANGLNAVRAGDADLYHASEHDHLDAHRALAYFAGLPGEQGIAPSHLIAWMRVGGGQDLWDELAAGFGVKAMLAGHSGRSCFVAGRRVDQLRDLAGEKVSVTGLARDVARGFGLEPVAVDAASLPDFIERGEILAAERGGAIASQALGLLSVAPFSVGTAINRHGAAWSLGLRRGLWDSLSESDQAIFAAAAAAETQLALAEEDAHLRLLRPEPRPETVWPVARELERAIGRVADAVVAHVAASDAFAARINASYVAFRRMLETDAARAPEPRVC